MQNRESLISEIAFKFISSVRKKMCYFKRMLFAEIEKALHCHLFDYLVPLWRSLNCCRE